MIFLSAEWRNLVMANYAIDPALLEKYVPAGTELDPFDGRYYVSLVGFLFKETKMLGISFPFHRNFEEINLRFYVRRKTEKGQWKRGVVFIKEIVPKYAISFIANTIYSEKYQTLNTRHKWQQGENLKVEYHWRFRRNWFHIMAEAAINSSSLIDHSLEEFITEHYWGYSRIDEKRSVEYEVRHPRWNLYKVDRYDVCCDFGRLYAPEFALLNKQEPDSVFLADGSPVQVMNRQKILI